MKTLLWLTALGGLCGAFYFAASLHVLAAVIALAVGAGVVPLIAAAVADDEDEPDDAVPPMESMPPMVIVEDDGETE